MQVIGISKKLTIDENKVTFVLDEEMPDEVAALLQYGNLELEADGRFLTVTKPDDGDPFTATTMQNLNEKIAAAVLEVEAAKARRSRMLEKLALRTVLPLI
jgi:hypothetical protein